MNLVVSSLTASAIAIDRLFMVLRKTPGQAQEKVSVRLPQFWYCPTFNIMGGVFQTGRICTIIGLIWVVSIVAILPAMFYTGTYDIYFPYSDLPLYHLCMEQWPHPWVHTVYSFILMMVRNARKPSLLPCISWLYGVTHNILNDLDVD